MATTSKRAAGRAASGNAPAASAGGSPVLQALLVGSAVAYGVWLLVAHGRMTWPPGPLLSSFYTLAGCLGLVGPVVLARRGRSDSGLGEMAWLVGGLLIWVHNLAALLRGEFRGAGWATPLGVQAMGLGVLAAMLAGWRLHGAGRSWGWTNVVGWMLGIFWVGMALSSFLPAVLATASAR